MARLYIIREKSMLGMWANMDCYVNDRIVCSVKNGEDVSCTIDDNSIIEFKCKMLNNAPSDTIHLNFKGKKIITLSIKQGPVKPIVIVHDKDAVVTKESKSSVRHDANDIFSPTKIIGTRLAINEDKRQWAICENEFNRALKTFTTLDGRTEEYYPVYSFDDIISFELLEDGETITKGGIGRAFIGAAAFGHTGAVVGAITGGKREKQICTNLSIKITTKNISNPAVFIKLITSSKSKNNINYKKEFENAHQILSALQAICDESNSLKIDLRDANATISVADEIRKFKALFDDGIISEEEFNEKKKELLKL